MKKLSESQQAKLEKIRSKRRGFFGEFKEFINKGSVMDLAVGVVVGSAFTTIVNSLVNDIIMPIVSLIAGGVDFTNLSIKIDNFFGTGDQAVIAYGNFIQNIVNFLLIAFCVFLVVKAMNKMREKADKLKANKEKKEEQAEEEAADETLTILKEIRDSLKKK